jgi:methionyl-tRNA formyltransferase
MGERITGGTVFWLDETVDGGPMAAQAWCFVRPGWTAQELWREALQPLGLRLLEQVLGDIERGILVRVPQDNRLATWEPSFERPPLTRPDLPLLGAGIWAEYTVVMNPEALHAEPRA